MAVCGSISVMMNEGLECRPFVVSLGIFNGMPAVYCASSRFKEM